MVTVIVFIPNVTVFNNVVKILLINHNKSIRKGMTHLKKFLESLKFGMDMYGKSQELMRRR